jgi:hypothetical protein
VGWFWPILQEGGPWAAFFMLLGLVIWMRLTDRWVTEKDFERTVAGYVETNKHQSTELVFLRQTVQDKDGTIRSLVDQNAKLTASSTVSAYALEQIMKEAPRRVLEP